MSQNVQNIAAAEAKNRFGEVLDTAQREPVIIKKHGRAFAVVLSADAYARLEALEDAWWGEQAKRVMKKPAFIGTKKSAECIASVLHAKH